MLILVLLVQRQMLLERITLAKNEGHLSESLIDDNNQLLEDIMKLAFEYPDLVGQQGARKEKIRR